MKAREYHGIPHDMDMDEIIEELDQSAQILLEMRKIVDAIMTQDLEIFEQDFFTLHCVDYDHETKKLLFKKLIPRIKNI